MGPCFHTACTTISKAGSDITDGKDTCIVRSAVIVVHNNAAIDHKTGFFGLIRVGDDADPDDHQIEVLGYAVIESRCDRTICCISQ